MRIFTERNLTIALVVGIAAGVLIGIAARAADSGAMDSFIAWAKLLGDVFLAMLKMVVVPLVLFSVTSGIANLHGTGEVGRKLAKTLAYIVGSTFFAVTLAIILTNVIGPGRGLDQETLSRQLPDTALAQASKTQQEIAARAPATMTEFINVQMGNLFMNPFEALAKTNLIGVVFFSLILGLMILLAGTRGDPARAFFDSMNEVLMKMVQVIIWAAPVGLFGLAVHLFRSLGWEMVAPLSKYFVTVSAGLMIHLFVFFPLFLFLVCRYNPIRFFIGFKEAMLFSLSTASSVATLPVSLRAAKEKLGVDKSSAEFVLPMGATINMNGTALYEAGAAMFVAQLIGMQLDLKAQIIVALTATLAAIGTAGIPQAGLVTMVVVFSAVGLPLELMALIIVVDRPLDHLRTMVNVTGDAVGAVFLSAGEARDGISEPSSPTRI